MKNPASKSHIYRKWNGRTLNTRLLSIRTFVSFLFPPNQEAVWEKPPKNNNKKK